MDTLSFLPMDGDLAGIAVAVMPTYVSKASNADLAQGTRSYGGSANRDLFIWSYRFMVSNESSHTLNLTGYWLKTIGENGVVRVIELDKSTIVNKGIFIQPNSVFESNEIVALPCRSGIIYGECSFVGSSKKSDIIVKIAPMSLDSADSRHMAH